MALTSDRFPYIPLRIRAGDGRFADMLIEALVDTGFDGDVVLPAGTVTAAPDFETTWRLADGSRVRSSTYVAEVELRGLSGSYPVMASVLGDEFFVGRGLTDRFLLVLDHGRQLTVEA